MFANEPVVWLGVVRAVVMCAVSFGLQLTPDQIGSIYVVSEAILTALTRQSVTPNGLAEYRVAHGYRPTQKIDGDRG